MCISPGDVMAYAAEAAVPKVDDQQVPDFLDVSYLEHSDIPVALGRVAKETVEEMLGSLTTNGSELVENEQVAVLPLPFQTAMIGWGGGGYWWDFGVNGGAFTWLSFWVLLGFGMSHPLVVSAGVSN